MCGIGGMIGSGISSAAKKNAAQRLQAALGHRGPDDRGTFVSKDDLAILVHTRLAILDPRATGAQPMSRGPYHLTFNGEIYNHAELRREMEHLGETFFSSTDTEVLLAGYIRYGEKIVPRLRGMFAFAIWNENDRSCFLARDPFGIKPLYYGRSPQGDFVFASELRAILASGLIERRLSPEGLESFLATGSIAEPHTLIQGVRLLEAGHSLFWQRGKLRGTSYFQIDFDEKPIDEVEAVNRTREAVRDSLRHHLISDVPVGIFLSGGLDSAVLLAATQPHGPPHLATFSIGVEHAALDEAPAARRLAAHFQTRHHELLLTQELAHHWIGPFLASLDQPTLDGFNTYCVSKLAADHGYKVVLSGIGGDELFGGYPSFLQVPRLVTAGRALRAFSALTPLVKSAALSPRQRRLVDYLSGPPTVSRAYDSFRSLFSFPEREVLRQRLFPAANPILSRERISALPDSTNSISFLELTRYLRNQLLRDADVFGMRHGLELRTPFLDPVLFSILRSLPAAIRLQPGKKLLKAAMPDIPAWHTAPRKRGFTFPSNLWLSEHWNRFASSLPPLPGVSLQSWPRKWALLVLHDWMQRHDVTA